MRSLLPAIMALAALAAPVAAQTAARPQLPPQAADAALFDANGHPSDFLRAAQNSIASGRIAEAQLALEMAQTRMLDRSVPLGRTNEPSDDITVDRISRARQSLAAHDFSSCLQSIQAAIASAVARGQ